jgi:hypothetical protein
MPVTVVPASIKPQLDAQGEAIKQRIKKATAAAAQKLADNILAKGRDDISSAGKFGTRWTQGLTVEVAGDDTSRTITLSHAIPYWTTHQFGAVISGRPLLWIPLSDAGLTGVSARDFPGRLFRVDRKAGGAPLLMSADDKQVKYTGHSQVRIPKRFHLIEIAQAETRTLGALFKIEMVNG